MGAPETVVEIPYSPRSLQLEIHKAFNSARFVVAVCHRRFGKTVMAINQLIKSAITCRLDRPRLAYIAPTYRQAKAIAWDYLKHYTAPIPARGTNESELRIDLPNGSRIQLFGADNPDSIRGVYLDGVVLDEVGMMATRTWTEVVRPALADRSGWALFIGTPNGKNLFWDLCTTAGTEAAWKLFTFKASETGIIAQPELESMRGMMTQDEYNQELECSFEASVRGSIYGAEVAAAKAEQRICSVPYDAKVPVQTFWDLGVGDSTAIWFAQAVGNEIRLIDYYESSGEGLQHYAGKLTAKGYAYSKHYAPFDIEVRELGSGQSRLEIARGLGINFLITPKISVDDGINAARMIFNRCWFDAKKCAAGIDALQNYRKRLGEFKATPVHDWASHGADAFRYMAVSLKPDRKAAALNYPTLGVI